MLADLLFNVRSTAILLYVLAITMNVIVIVLFQQKYKHMPMGWSKWPSIVYALSSVITCFLVISFRLEHFTEDLDPRDFISFVPALGFIFASSASIRLLGKNESYNRLRKHHGDCGDESK